MLYIAFPIIAAMFYGLAYAAGEKALKLINISTYMLMGWILGIPILLFLTKIKGEPISFEFAQNPKDLWFIVIAVIAPNLGWLFTLYAVQKTNASYTAFAEISYPLFTILFLFVLFGIKHFDWHLLIGGTFVMVGSFLLVLGQIGKNS